MQRYQCFERMALEYLAICGSSFFRCRNRPSFLDNSQGKFFAQRSYSVRNKVRSQTRLLVWLAWARFWISACHTSHLWRLVKTKLGLLHQFLAQTNSDIDKTCQVTLARNHHDAINQTRRSRTTPAPRNASQPTIYRSFHDWSRC